MANKTNSHFNGFIFIFTLVSLILSSASLGVYPTFGGLTDYRFLASKHLN